MSTPGTLRLRRAHFPLRIDRRVPILIGIVLLFVAIPAAWAQQQCNLQSTITDIDGNHLPGARIAVRLDGRELSSVTANDQGIATAPNIASGTYEVMVEKEGFRSSRQVVVVADQGTAIGVTFLPKITRTEEVEVHADVDGSAEDRASASQSLQREEMKPLSARPATVKVCPWVEVTAKSRGPIRVQ